MKRNPKIEFLLPLTDELPDVSRSDMGEIEGLSAIFPMDLGQLHALRSSLKTVSFMTTERGINIEGSTKDEL